MPKRRGWRVVLVAALMLATVFGVAFYLVDRSLVRPYLVSDFQWSADGKRLITTYEVGTVEVSTWDERDRRTTRTMAGPSKWAAIQWPWNEGTSAGVVYTGMSPDEKYIVGKGSDRELRLWDAGKESHPELFVPDDRDRHIDSERGLDPVPIWCPLGRRIAFAQPSGVFVWEVGSNTSTRLQNGYNGEDGRAEWSPDGKLQVYCGSDKQVCLYRSESKKSGETIAWLQWPRFAWNPDCRHLALWSTRILQVLDLQTRQVIKLVDDKGCLDYAWSPDGKMLAFVEEEGVKQPDDTASGGKKPRTMPVSRPILHIWSLDGARLMHSIPITTSPSVYTEASLAWSRDSKRIGTTKVRRGNDFIFGYELKWWDAAAGQVLGETLLECPDPDSYEIPYTEAHCFYRRISEPKWSPDLDKLAYVSEMSVVLLQKHSVDPPIHYGWTSDIRFIYAPPGVAK